MTKFFLAVKNFIRRKSIKDIFNFQISDFFSRGISLISSVIFARILGPNDYGVYSLIFVFASLISLVDIGYTRAAITLLPEAYTKKDKKGIRDILVYFIKINLVIYAPLYLSAIIFAPYITGYLYQNYQIGNLARLIILSMLLLSFSGILNINLEAKRRIKHLATIENVSNFLKNFLPILLIALGFGLSGLIFGYTLAVVIIFILSITSYYFLAKNDEYVPSFSSLLSNLNSVKMNYNIKFTLSTTIDATFGNFLSNLPILILSLIATPAVVGFYKIGLNYVSLSNILINSVSRLLNVKFPQDKVINIKLLKKNFYQSSLVAGLIFIAILIPLIILAPFLVIFFYGPEFKPVVGIIYWLALYLSASGFSIGFGPIYRVARKNYLSMFFNFFRMIFGLILFSLFYYLFNFSGLISVLIFQAVIGSLTTPLHFLYIKKFVLDKFEISRDKKL